MTTMEQEALLSAIVVVGPHRDRGQLVMDSLCSQTCVEAIEIVVVDLAAEGTPNLQSKPGVRVTYIRLPKGTPWGRARATGVRRARSPIAAFIEEHCPAEPGWAAAVIEAHRGPWAAVTYAFTNGGPDEYLHRSAWMADYGLWAHPTHSGPSVHLPGNNVAYKRALLMELGEKLEEIIAVDFGLHEYLRRRGLPMYVEARALAAHQSPSTTAKLLRGNYAYARLMAARRASRGSWSGLRRVLCGLGAPFVVPLLRMFRLARSLRGRRALWSTFLTALPITYAVYLSAATGEAVGYLLGLGNAETEFVRAELEASRAGKA
jgi:hypothetical protein